jgi:hypothetical protein
MFGLGYVIPLHISLQQQGREGLSDVCLEREEEREKECIYEYLR